MKIIVLGLVLVLSACAPMLRDHPAKDVVAKNVAAKKPKTKKIETIDLDTADVKVDEKLETIADNNLNTPPPDTKTEKIKPVKIAKVDSKPANFLLADANRAMSAGNYSRAETLLQRALRISPRDPKLWHKMAQIKYAKGDYHQAEAMAMRTNTMTSSSSMKRQNWRIIANSREKQGDMAGAEQAHKYAHR